MTETPIQCLADFATLRTAPELNPDQRERLRPTLADAMASFEWFTVGIMAPSKPIALNALRSLEISLSWEAMTIKDDAEDVGPVFLKANQSNGLIRIRVEHGLGEGILISGHSNIPEQTGMTWGPLPLDFFA